VTRWAEFATDQPELATDVRRCFGVRKHATMATLRRDGSPRMSGTEVEFDDERGELVLGSMRGARKAQDLLRDPRVALHGPTVDPPEENPAAWPGEAKSPAGRFPSPVATPAARTASPSTSTRSCTPASPTRASTC
jgi:hypothetical protein